MGVRYGINGNDLNWDSVIHLNSFNMDLERAIFDGDVELDEDGYVPEDVAMGYDDSNPTIVYYDGDVDIQQVLKEGKKFDEYVDWFIVHDTNSNGVDLVGEVPNEYMTDEYLEELREYLGE